MSEHLDALQFKAAALLIKLKLLHNATQNVVDNVVSGVDSLFESFLDFLQDHFRSGSDEKDIFTVPEILDELQKLRGQSMFEGLNSTTKLDKYLNERQGLVTPEKVVLKSTEVIIDNVIDVVDVDFAWYIPFLPLLGQILSCPEVLHCIDNPKPVTPGVFTSPLDSYFYLNHPVTKDDPFALAFGLYTDGVELTDTASSKSGEHSVTFIYLILYNIHPDLISRTRAIFLLGCIKTSVLKEYGYNKILADFIAGMNKLCSTDGVTFKIDGEDRVFHGVFVCCCGDNPASENIGGFKESHFANKPCRQCQVHREEMFKHFNENKFPMRSMQLHEAQVKELEEYNLAPNAKIVNPSVAHGINTRSPLMSITGCDVTKCLPQDFMHDTIEGSLKLEICCLLSDVIEKKQLSLPLINLRIQFYARNFGINQPAYIEARYLEKKRLRLTAAETLNLAYMLPFVLRKRVRNRMVSACSEDNLKCFMMRLQLNDILMAEELTYNDVVRIRQLTESHHTLFQRLYNCAIPKMHYEVHSATHILLYGPPRYYWCFRFEGKHAYFKRLMKILRCFKDPSGMFALCHQRKLCGLMMLSAMGDSGPYLQSTDCVGAKGGTKSLQFLPHGLVNLFPNIPQDAQLSVHRVVSVGGVTYRKKHVIMLSKDGEMPKFGEIVQILQHNGQVVFVYKQFITECFEESLRAFKVKYRVGVDREVILADSLPHHHKLFLIRSTDANFVVTPCRK